ncbi:hypothetical protein NKR23_g2920 [Pleurostoma richardsiae]|uniref:Uncharacterized protein n=1 Tax=Pleurostoma richardsiae TaxID=41990 RepID=A0AA38VMQ6_9PEZI|nr:hypothetical protein NKR23_g2920 [Pleurostoma richardsiae]
MVQYYNHVSDMTDDDVRALTRVLVMPPQCLGPGGEPTQTWLERQTGKIETTLPRELLMPRSVVDRLRISLAARGLTTDKLLPQVASLCATHRRLNPWLIHHIFTLLKHELTVRADRVRCYEGELKTAEVHDFLARLTGVMALWVQRRDLTAFFGRDAVTPPAEGSHPLRPIRPRCEACYLAAVGARAQLLVDLRAALVGRSSSAGGNAHGSSGPPRLLRLVEAWVEGFGGDAGADMLGESDRLGRRLRRIRKADRTRAARIAADRRVERGKVEEELGGRNVTASEMRVLMAKIEVRLAEKYARAKKNVEKDDCGGGYIPGEKSAAARMAHGASQARERARAAYELETSTFEPNASTEHLLADFRDQQHELPDEPRPQHVNGFYSDGNSEEDHSCLYELDDERALLSPDTEFDEHDPGDEYDMEQSIINWYARSAVTSRPAELSDGPHQPPPAELDAQPRPFTNESAVPSALNIRDKNGIATSTGKTSYEDQWTDVTYDTTTAAAPAAPVAVSREAGSSSSAPPVPPVPARFRNLFRTEEPCGSEYIIDGEPLVLLAGARVSSLRNLVHGALAPSSVYSQDNCTVVAPQVPWSSSLREDTRPFSMRWNVESYIPARRDWTLEPSLLAEPLVARHDEAVSDEEELSSPVLPSAPRFADPWAGGLLAAPAQQRRQASSCVSPRATADVSAHPELQVVVEDSADDGDHQGGDGEGEDALAGGRRVDRHDKTYMALTGMSPSDEDGIRVGSILPDDSISRVGQLRMGSLAVKAAAGQTPRARARPRFENLVREDDA